MQEWLDWLPEPARSAVLAIIGTVAAIYGILRYSDKAAKKDLQNGEGPSAGAVLKQSIDANTAAMERFAVAMEQFAKDMSGFDANFSDNNANFRVLNGLVHDLIEQSKDQTTLLRQIDRELALTRASRREGRE